MLVIIKNILFFNFYLYLVMSDLDPKISPLCIFISVYYCIVVILARLSGLGPAKRRQGSDKCTQRANGQSRGGWWDGIVPN